MSESDAQLPSSMAAILQAGLWAPSADNRHPFRFEVTEHAIRLWGTEDLLQAPLHRRILSLISLGAVVENMCLEAARLGFTLTPRFLPVDVPPALIVDIACEASPPCDDPLAAAIRLRCTNRRFFHGPALADVEREALAAQVAAVAGVRMQWLDGKNLRKQALRLIRMAETERFGSRPLHQELFSAVRFDAGWHQAPAEGLAPGSLEIERPLRPLFARLRHWPVMRLLKLAGAHHLIGMRAGFVPCLTSPHLGVILASGEIEFAAIRAGRAFERLWLESSLRGLALQPLAASAIMTLPDYGGVSADVRRALQEGWADIAPGLQPFMVFRLGHAGAPSLRSARPPLSRFLGPASG